nr:capsid protein [Cressdnaviricota sp.]
MVARRYGRFRFSKKGPTRFTALTSLRRVLSRARAQRAARYAKFAAKRVRFARRQFGAAKRLRQLARLGLRAINSPVHLSSNGILPMRKYMTFRYSFRSSPVTIGAGSNIYDTILVNSMYDPDSTGNNLGNKNYMGQAVWLNSSYYGRYEVIDYAFTYKYVLVSDPTIAVGNTESTLASGSGTIYNAPGVAAAVPIEVWVTPDYTNQNSEGTAVDTAAELKKTPGARRYDLMRRGSVAKFTKMGNVKRRLRQLMHQFDDGDISAAYNASPSALLQHAIYVYNNNSVAASIMLQCEWSIKVCMFGLLPGNIPETYGS